MIRARVIQSTEIRGDERVDVWGFEKAGPDETLLNNAYFEVAPPPPPELGEFIASGPAFQGRAPPSVLTQVSDIEQLRPEEAAQQLAVRLRGIITYADPEWRDGFLQDRAMRYCYVDIDPSQRQVNRGNGSN